MFKCMPYGTGAVGEALYHSTEDCAEGAIVCCVKLTGCLQDYEVEHQSLIGYNIELTIIKGLY